MKIIRAALKVFVVLALLAALGAPNALAVNCHCFTDKDFIPEEPAKADAYLLATVRNTLLAVVTGMEKSSVVRAKMEGAEDEDLWIAFKVSQSSKRLIAELMEAKASAKSWKGALAALSIDPKTLGEDFSTALAASDQKAAALAADGELARIFKADGQMLAKLRGMGAGNAEIASLYMLNKLNGRDPAEMYSEVLSSKASFGSLFSLKGLTPKEAGRYMATFK